MLVLTLLTAGLVTIGLASQPAHATNSPSWWSGDCDVNHNPHSYPLGASYNGVEACGPRPNYTPQPDHLVNFGAGVGEYEWECVELVMRYMYLVYGIAPYYLPGGDAYNVVSAYSGRVLNKVTNASGSRNIPTPGDILAFAASANHPIYGHTAVVTDVRIDGSGNGTVTYMQQNASADGWGSVSVSNYLLGDSITGWLHNPNYHPPAPPPPTPYDPRLRAASHLSADFTGDGRPDIAVLYDYGNNDTAVLVFRNTGSGFAAPTVWWDSGPGNWIWASSKPLVGDFNGDGKPDIAIAYDYGNSDMGLLVLANTGTSFRAAQSWYRSGPGGVNLWAAKLVAADFNGDGKPDIAALYDYGNNDTALLVFINTGSSFRAPVSWWNSGPGNWAWGSSTPLVGDFNGDGKPDVMVMYDYGNSDMGLLFLANTGSSFSSPVTWYRSGPGGVNAGAAWPIVGDFNGDGKPDVLMMYDYGNNWTDFLLFPNTGSGFSGFKAIWDSGIGNWSWGQSVPLTADFNGDGKPNVVVMYNYGNNDTGLNLLPNTGMALGSPATSWYRSGPGSFNWGAATAM